VLINLEKVGDLGHRADDVVLLGKCDEIVRELARELGWEEELQKAWEATAESVEPEKVESTAAVKTSTTDELNKKEKERLQTEVDKLTSDVEKSLTLTDNLTDGEQETTDPNLSVKQEEPVPKVNKQEKPSVASGADSAEGPKVQLDDKL
jgi:NAD-dependent histone deacetylase SIR2